MVKAFNEKDIIELDLFKERGISLANRDISQEYDEKTKKYISRINFSGFELDENDEIVYFFPFRYKIIDLELDGIKLFKTIYKHVQKRPELYFGKKADNNFVSNYPFASFFKIFEYYLQHGLYSEYYEISATRKTSKVNWKKTISNSKKYIIDNTLFLDPIFYKSTLRNHTFLTDCMTFILEYTIDKFGNFMGLSSLGFNVPSLKFLDNRKEVVKELFTIKASTFNTKTNMLIDEMIKFFEQINIGGSYHIKHYNFASIWEDMVNNYLNKKFVRAYENYIDLSGEDERNTFAKRTFYPNKINPSQNIQPDNYLEDSSNIYIFDAKYYEPEQIDYKQICYNVFLSGSIKNLSNVYSALLVPNEFRKTIQFFEVDPAINTDLDNLKINIEYIDMRDVIKVWLES